MNTEMTAENPNPQTIQMNSEPQGSTALSRRQASDKRKEDFFKELQAARDAEITPFTQTPTIQSPANTPAGNETHQSEEPAKQDYSASNSEVNSDEDDEPTGKYIPKARLDKEIAKRKVLEEEARTEREARIRLETEQRLYNDALAELNKKNNSSPIESASTIDPVDADAHNLYMKEINILKEQQTNNLKVQQEYQVRAQFAQTVDRQAAEFSAKHSDFSEAYNYVLGVEAEKAKMMGYNETEAQKYALEQLQPIAWKAYEKGLNVAEIAYNMAQKYGYRSKAAKTETADLAKVEKNMAKSHSAIDEVRGVPTKLSSPDESALDMEVFNRNFAGSRGRGIDPAKFKALLSNVGKQNRY